MREIAAVVSRVALRGEVEFGAYERRSGVKRRDSSGDNPSHNKLWPRFLAGGALEGEASRTGDQNSKGDSLPCLF